MLEWCLPWPLGYAHWVWRRLYAKETLKAWRVSRSRVDDNALLTVAIVIWCACAFALGARLDSFEKNYAADSGKILFSGAFLIGTILSVSVALPGQALARLALGTQPRFAFYFVMPFVWGFGWGVTGALLMMFFPALHSLAPDHPIVAPTLMAAATFVALYGALMELNTILHTVRQYLIGMILWSEAIEKEQAKTTAPSVGSASNPVLPPPLTSATQGEERPAFAVKESPKKNQ